MDLLDSIMSNMQKPPVVNSKQKELMKQQQKAMEEARQKEKEYLNEFRSAVSERIVKFIEDECDLKKAFEPMDTVGRSIVRDLADMAGLTAYVFGIEEEDKYVMVFKKGYPLTEEEIAALRRGDEYDPIQAAKEAILKKQQMREQDDQLEKNRKEVNSAKRHLERYERQAGKETAIALEPTKNRQFGFVKSEYKKDKRTIEETLADIRAAKKLKKESES